MRRGQVVTQVDHSSAFRVVTTSTFAQNASSKVGPMNSVRKSLPVSAR